MTIYFLSTNQWLPQLASNGHYTASLVAETFSCHQYQFPYIKANVEKMRRTQNWLHIITSLQYLLIKTDHLSIDCQNKIEELVS